MIQWYRGWTVIVAAILFQTVSIGSVYYGFTFWIGPWMREFGGSRAGIMLALTCATIMMGLLSPLAGRALDRYSIRALVCVGAVLLAAGFALIAIATSISQIVIVYATLLAGAVVLTGPLAAQTLAAKWFGARRGLAIGMVSVGISVGGFLVPPLLGALFTHFDWRQIHLILAVGALVVIVPPSWLIIRNTPEEAGIEPEPGRESSRIDPAARWNVRAILLQRTFWILGIAFLIANLVQNAIQQNLGPLADDLSLPVQRASALVSLFAAGAIAGRVVFGALADRSDTRHLFWAALALVVVTTPLMMGSPGYGILLVACVIQGFADGCYLPVLGVAVSRYFGLQAFGQVTGLLLFLIQGTAMFGAVLMGWLRDRTGSYDLPLTVMMALLVPAALAAIGLPKNHRA